MTATSHDRSGASGIVAAEVEAAARHGSYCPKMCTFACPVTAATGRADAVPWSFHRTVIDLLDGRLAPGPAAASRLTACSGCLACRRPCEFDQDVPEQVKAGRAWLAAEGAPLAAAEDAVAAVEAGRSPFGVALASDDVTSGAAVALLAGCRDDPAIVAAAARLLEAAGVEFDVRVPAGCCGAALADLGASDTANEAGAVLRGQLEGYERVLLLDPHCAPTVTGSGPTAARHLIVELAGLVGRGALRFRQDRRTVTYHDPCLLARQDGVTEPPRTLLRATGATIAEPEHHGVATACSGGGLAFELVDPEAATATADRRRAELAATAGKVIVACAGSGRALEGANSLDDAGPMHIVNYLADHLEET